MFKSKRHAALDLLSNNGKGGILLINHVLESGAEAGLSVRRMSSDLCARMLHSHMYYPGLHLTSHLISHLIFFDRVDAALILSTSLRTTVAAGPSGLDAHAWRRLCTAFRASSASLCHSLASVTKRLCSTYVDPTAVSPLLTNLAVDCSGQVPWCEANWHRRHCSPDNCDRA